MRKLANRTEGQERTETQGCGRVSIHQGITDQNTVLIMVEDHFLFQHDTTHAIRCRWHETGIKLSDVLVSVRTEVVALILVKSQVELSSMLDNRTVERRQEDMIVIIELRHGNHQQTMVLTRITIHECGTAIRTRTIGPE